MNVYKWIALLMLMIGSPLKSQVTLPKIIGHNMVLQRNKPVSIWGWASSGESVTVKFGNQLKKTITDTSKQWMIKLDPLQASDKPAEMIISGNNTIVLKNILVGEVWLCSGQSNMEYSMRKNSKSAIQQLRLKPTEDELSIAGNPNIRIFLVNRKTMSPDSIHKGWSIAQDSALRAFSAVGYFYAKELFKELHVPIGVISSAVSGSRIEPWISKAVFETSDYFRKDDTLKVSSEAGKFYTTMIQPLVPFTLKGFLWYQGETNCFLRETIQYAYKMQLLINSWRSAWLDKALPFYFVQIAPFYYSSSKQKIPITKETLPKFREAQALALKIPNTGMVVITDLVDSLNGIHPLYKAEVGRRLALWSLAKDYGKDVVYSGPMYKQMRINGNTIEIEFDNCGSGLISNDGKPLSWFEIAGSDGKFAEAAAVKKGNEIIVSAPTVLSPVEVRFAWDEAAQPNLFNKEGLPAVPFRTNNPLLSLYQLTSN
jgi:sialate O-acetylesterase